MSKSPTYSRKAKPSLPVKETATAPYNPRPNQEVMSASHFKAHCLEVMDNVRDTNREVIITKYNIPVAKLVPFKDDQPGIIGFMKGTVTILGDIVSPDPESWDADS